MSLPDQRHQHARLLVVDDNPVNVELLLDLLEEAGYEQVSGLTDPRQVMPRLERELPDLILLDIRMPHLDGHQLLERLRRRWAEQTPPVIVLSAQTDRETRLNALTLGARDFLAKPFDQHEVLQRIRNTLDVHFLLRERNDQARLLQSLVDERTAEIQRLSFRDPATDLPNRRALLAELEQALRQQQPLTLAYMALHGFDEINRLHGHALGERLSQQLCERLQRHFSGRLQLAVWKNTDWVARMPLLDSTAREQLLGELIACIGQPFIIDHLRLQLSARIGISHSQMPHGSADDLLRLAALALPEDSDQWRLYQPDLEQAMQRRIRYREALHEAIARQQMSLVYQPKVELRSGRVTGAEALLRWVHPELGFVSPAEFIPLAEASGEILRIGDWVLDRAILQLEEWLGAGLVPADFRVAVNVASLQLMQPDFASRLLERLGRSCLPRGALEIEVTESGLMQDIALAQTQLQQLTRHGLSIAIDDFGTGYSSLAYLKTLPVSVLKIDRAFVSEIDSNAQDLRLAETVVQMARNFGFVTVAEGIERPEHIATLQEIGCQLGQGYWFSPPLRAESFIDFYQQGRALQTAASL